MDVLYPQLRQHHGSRNHYRQRDHPRRHEQRVRRRRAIYGQILDGAAPVVGALVRVTNDTTSTILGHAYSGCDGNYMLAVPAGSLTATDVILIEVVDTDLTRTPTACAT